jgi:hypothetical protein
MEDNLIFLKMEDNLICYGNGGLPNTIINTYCNLKQIKTMVVAPLRVT